MSGLAHCGDCGKPMYGCNLTQKRRGKKYTYPRYICSTSRRRGRAACSMNAVDQGDLLRSVLAGLSARLATPGALGELRAEAARVEVLRDQAGNAARVRLQARLTELERDLATAGRNLALAPDHVRDVVAEQVRQIRAEQAQVSGDLAALDLPPEEAPPAALLEEAVALLPQLAEEAEAEGVPPPQVHAALALLVSQVTVVFRHRPVGKPRTFIEGLDVELSDDLALLLSLPKRASSELYHLAKLT